MIKGQWHVDKEMFKNREVNLKAKEAYEGIEYKVITIITGHDADRYYFKPLGVVIYESSLKCGDVFFDSQLINDRVKFKEK